MGAAVVRAYGLDEHTDRRVKHAIDAALPGADRGALARRDAVAAVVDVLRDRRLGGRGAGRLRSDRSGA